MNDCGHTESADIWAIIMLSTRTIWRVFEAWLATRGTPWDNKSWINFLSFLKNKLTGGKCRMEVWNVRLRQTQRLDLRQFPIFRFSGYQQPECVECWVDTGKFHSSTFLLHLKTFNPKPVSSKSLSSIGLRPLISRTSIATITPVAIAFAEDNYILHVPKFHQEMRIEIKIQLRTVVV